jgi:integrase
MATCKFYLDQKSDDQQDCNIFYKVNVGTKNFKVYPGERIDPAKWAPGKGMKGSSTDAMILNNRLKETCNDILKMYLEAKMLAGKEPDFQTFKDAVRARYAINPRLDKNAAVVEPAPVVLPPTLLDLVDGFIEVNSLSYSGGTIKHVRVLRRLLEDYALEKKKSLLLADLDIDFFNGFKSWLVECGRYINDSANNHLKKLRAVLNFHWRKGKQSIREAINLDYSRFDLLPTMDKDQAYMNMDEVLALYRLDLTEQPYLERVRDLYVFCSMAGPRHIDLFGTPTEPGGLTEENIHARTTLDGQKIHVLRYVQIKTGFECEAPLNDIALALIEKYRGKYHWLFSRISNQKANDYLGEILRHPGLNGLFENKIKFVSKQGSKKVTVTTPRWEALGFHSSRSNLATFLGEQGMRTKEIGKILGHKSERTTSKYIKHDQQSANQKAFALLNNLAKSSDPGDEFVDLVAN